MTQDERFMREALCLARKGVGRTSPNPCVGAVVVRGGRIMGRGWHRAAGMPHAEVEALREAASKSGSLRSATLYVTLEPCCTQGRTPPCTKAILASGIRRVVVGATDPNPAHQGRGFVLLRRAGVKVVSGVLEADCKNLNRAWNHWIQTRTPWVIAKWGMTLDGKIATASGESRWITSATSRHLAHQFRSEVDAVLVGIETVLNDNPSLQVQSRAGAPRQPVRVILDHRARTPLTSRLMKDQGERPWIFVGPGAGAKAVSILEKAGARVFRLKRKGDLRGVLRRLGREQITSVMVEGGGRILGSFFDEHRVHETRVFIAPMILGGTASRKAVAGLGVARWKDAAFVEDACLQTVGPDLWVVSKVTRP